MLLHIEFHSTLCKDSDTLTTTKVFSGVVKEELLKCFSRSRKLKNKTKQNRKKEECVPGNKRTTLKSNKKKSQDNRCTAAIESSQSKLEEEVRRLF